MMSTKNKPLLYYEQEYQPSSSAWLVLIHGAGGSSDTWRLQREALARHFNLLLIDLPGHGKTAPLPDEASKHSFENIAERIWRVVDYLQLNAVHLIGTSLGSIICLQMRVLRPQQVASMILAGAVVKLNTKLKLLVAICPSLAKLMGHKSFIRFGAHLILPRKNHKNSRDIFIRESHALGKEEFNRWMGLFSTLNQTLQSLFCKTSTIPHLLVSGSQDHLFLAPAKEYVDKHNNVEIEIFPNCGHVVTIERAKRFNRACIEYLHRIVHALA